MARGSKGTAGVAPNLRGADSTPNSRKPSIDWRRGTLALAAVVSIIAAGVSTRVLARAQTAYPYTLTALQTLGGDNSGALGVNDSGEVTGGASVKNGDGTDAVTWRAGHITDLGRIGGRIYSAGTSVNDAGVVAGTGAGTQPYLSTGGVWNPQSGWTTFSRGLCASGANSINDTGVVGGYTCHQDGSTDQSRAVLWLPRADASGYRQVLLAASDWSSSVSQVANTGDSIGVQTDDNFVAHAMYWSRNSKWFALPPLDGPNTIAWGLAAKRTPPGVSLFAVGGGDSSSSTENGCYWQLQMSPNRRRIIDAPARCRSVGSIAGFPASELLAVNRRGEAVGDA